ncbi:MAG: phospho-N-acetylmuramoyl-pentapeptide-transferase, partial [Bacteroidaceae bacterium]|nr:phospho-N-acetylmuramoyl-pentapeptide-transferase [Bacteroidaceae bacterium]
MLVIVGASNAVNLTDGKDGLASGCTIFCALTYAVFAYLMGHKVFSNYLSIPYIAGVEEAVVFAAALCGGCIGFL